MQEQQQIGIDPAITAARAALGGDIAPTARAFSVAGMPGVSRTAVSLARRQHRLPFHEVKIGGRYFVTAAAYADAFLRPVGTGEREDDDPAPHSKGGRPRKVASPRVLRAGNAGEVSHGY